MLAPASGTRGRIALHIPAFEQIISVGRREAGLLVRRGRWAALGGILVDVRFHQSEQLERPMSFTEGCCKGGRKAAKGVAPRAQSVTTVYSLQSTVVVVALSPLVVFCII